MATNAEELDIKITTETDTEAEKAPAKEKPVDDPLKVEVVDDTPEQDRGRAPLPKEVVEELENDSLEEYSTKVKQRLSQMKKAWHDERREKERLQREREEAFNFASRAHNENRALKQRLGQGEKIFISEVTKAAATQIEMAKQDLQKAYEKGDPELIAEANNKLVESQMKLREYQNFRPSLQEDEEGVQPAAQRVQPGQVTVSQKAAAWRRNNDWFGKNKGMTAFALGLHEELVESGYDPESDEYYSEINSAIKKRFPEMFARGQTITDEDRDTPAPTPRKAAPQVVAPATRSTAPRQVRLNQSQLALAKKLGLTPEQYARELIKLENSNG